jgi:tRNA uridine 5-carbamoylmethylation protein Kti12
MNHQLYIVEGLPCSGKSETSKYIADILKSNGFHTQY